MVKSFDDLLSFLLDEVALCGEEGMRVLPHFHSRPYPKSVESQYRYKEK